MGSSNFSSTRISSGLGGSEAASSHFFSTELSHVLVRDCEIESVFARLGKNLGEGIRCKVLELIDIEIEISSLFLRCIGTQKVVSAASGKSPSNISGFYFKKFLDRGIIEESTDEQEQKKKWRLRPEFAPLYAGREIQQSMKRLKDRQEKDSEQGALF